VLGSIELDGAIVVEAGGNAAIRPDGFDHCQVTVGYAK
jgi:hypothetical protein